MPAQVQQPAMMPMRLQAGMTMIEVLVSLVIFSIGFLGLVGLQARAAQVSTDAEDRSRAALLANDIVSTMWAQKTVALPAGMLANWQARVADPATAGLPSAVGTISAPDLNNVVTVSITWHAPSHKNGTQDSQYSTQVTMP